MEHQETATDQQVAQSQNHYPINQNLEARLRIMEPEIQKYEQANQKLNSQLQEFERSNRKLSEQLQVMNHFFDQSLIAAAILDRNFNFIAVNGRYAKADKRNVEDFIGKNHFEIYPSAAKEIFDRVVKTKRPYQTFARPFVYQGKPERGVTYWDWTLAPVLDDDDEVDLLLLSLRDVTQRRKAEIELERFFALSPDLFCIVSLENFCFLRINDAFTTTLGYSRKELGSLPFTNLIHPDDFESAMEYLQSLKESQTDRLLLSRYRCKDGSYRYLRWNCISVTAESLFYAVACDVTNEIRMRDEMVNVENMKVLGEMAAIVGHEVRNPLASARALLQLLDLKTEDDTLKSRFGIIIRELDRATEIMSRFLSLAKDKPLNRQLHSLNDILAEMFPLIEASAFEQGMSVQLELGNIIDLMLDKEEIHQLVLNLVNNGLQAMSSGGFLKIQTKMQTKNVALAIQDEGEGISPNILNKVDTLFFTTKKRGTGLGLVVCKHIAARHNAKVKIEPQSTGTLVSVIFEV